MVNQGPTRMSAAFARGRIGLAIGSVIKPTVQRNRSIIAQSGPAAATKTFVVTGVTDPAAAVPVKLS